MDTRSNLRIKADALQRLMMNNMLSGILPLYIVTEYPKSGGTWVGQILSEYLGVPFPRNRRPKVESCVMHGHLLYTPFLKNVFCVLRDGRDVVVSAYYHMLFENERSSPLLVKKTRVALQFNDYNDIQKNLPRFIEYLFVTENRRIFHFNWAEFIDSWWGRRQAAFVRYEEMLAGAAEALKSPIERITDRGVDMMRLRTAEEKFSFARLANRQAGEEDTQSFLRKGISGDWKNKFTREAREVFDHYAGEQLIRLGYETNGAWIADPERSKASV